MTAKFIAAEQIWQDEQTRYWFELDGAEYCVAESGPTVTYLRGDGDEINNAADRERVRRECVVTDAMRAQAAGL